MGKNIKMLRGEGNIEGVGKNMKLLNCVDSYLSHTKRGLEGIKEYS